MRFVYQPITDADHSVFAVDPRQGNDAALLAVFNNPYSAQELAQFLNVMYDQYLRVAPMVPAVEQIAGRIVDG